MAQRRLAVVTGASTGIGFELARIMAKEGYDLIVAADEPEIERAAKDLSGLGGASARAVQADLATEAGVDQLLAATEGRAVDVLMANAGRGLGEGFLDQDWPAARRVVDTNITGTIYLIQQVGRAMRARGDGRILITGSIAGFMPGPFSAVYNGTKAFVNSFSHALRNELQDSGVTVTCLMPGATQTPFFERAGLSDTEEGTVPKDDPAEVARTGYDAMMRGDGDVVYGLQNKVQSALANVLPASVVAEQSRKQAEPGSAGQ